MTGTMISQANNDWHHTVEAMYRSEFAGLRRLAGRLLNPAAAEEAVQEAFARFATMSARPGLGFEASYLRSMVMNEARSVLRRRQLHDRHLHRWLIADGVGVAETVIAVHEQRETRRRLEILPTRQRQVIELRFLDQLSEREVAERLGISTGSVKTHAFRAMAALRSSWGGEAA